jgi:ATP-dependent Clp protease adapter protein ClpS
MATATLLNPVSEEAEDRKKQAKDHWKAIQQSGPLVSSNSLRIGFHAAALKREGLFGLIGFADEKEAQEASGVKQSTWFNVLRIAEAFPGVDEKLFIGMKLTNAETLMDMPESKRLTEYWMRRASTDSIELFSQVVDTDMDGKARASDGRERVVSINIKVPTSTKKVVEEGLREYAKAAGCEGNEAKAIELMVAEHSEGVSLVGTITKAINRIAEIRTKAEMSAFTAEETLDDTLKSLEEIVGDFQVALQSLQNLDSGE